MTFDQLARLTELREKQHDPMQHLTGAELEQLSELERQLKTMRAAAAPAAAELHARQVADAKKRRERAERVVNTALGVVDFTLSLVGGILGRR